MNISAAWKIHHSLGLCGCGTGSEYEIVLLLLERAEKRKLDSTGKHPGFYDACGDASGRWVEFAAKVIDRVGLLDHGTGIGASFITDEGTEFLAFLREYGTDEDKWPEEPGD